MRKTLLAIAAAAAVLMPGGAWAGKHHPITEAEQEHCLMQDGNEAGEVWCIKSDVGMSKAQIDAYFLEEGKKVAAEVLSQFE